ncbi:uracil-DNA glycosylase [Crenobacter caeni]|uniref:Type-4 uracil-DNA glycosylase n=1 Tax=Crenobacter caeni TaxID=2705474 RepID=A0A6B2KPF6_9NEIS|nr:uracil-DNA glycosylase [Crenobacter caeni]NDV12080.1 uracil-DNA glycosylase [Crenobacter caeni]
MSRRLTLVDAMGLGPAWYPRGTYPQAEAEAPLATAAAQPVYGESATLLPPQENKPAVPTPAPPAQSEPAAVAPGVAAQPTPQLGWAALAQTVAACQACPLAATRRQTVFGRGNPEARWMLVGEAPGEQEDRQGEPFVGRAGQLLDNMLAALGLDRERDVYIANVIKCRPPGNRNPEPAEIATCRGYLDAQIAHVKPDIILALGRFAAQTLLGSNETIGRLRGREHRLGDIPLVATFHPAYLLRSPSEKARAWQDLLLACRLLG